MHTPGHQGPQRNNICDTASGLKVMKSLPKNSISRSSLVTGPTGEGNRSGECLSLFNRKQVPKAKISTALNRSRFPRFLHRREGFLQDDCICPIDAPLPTLTLSGSGFV